MGNAEPEMDWEPMATLIPSTGAPLGCRINVPPLASALPSIRQPAPLEGMSLDEQEALILEDLLFVFMVRGYRFFSSS